MSTSKRKKRNPGELEKLKKDHDDAIVEGMAVMLWDHAFQTWRETETFCDHCGEAIWEDRNHDGVWVDSRDGEVCSETAFYIEGDVHEPGAGRRDQETPTTPLAAYEAAADMAEVIVAANGMALSDLYDMAMSVHTGEAHEFTDADLGKDGNDTPVNFGMMLASECIALAMKGDGARWSDHHVVERPPHAEFAPMLTGFVCTYNGESLEWKGGGAYTPSGDGIPAPRVGEQLFVVFMDPHGSTYADTLPRGARTREQIEDRVREIGESYGVMDDGDQIRWKVVSSTDAGAARLAGGPWPRRFTYRDGLVGMGDDDEPEENPDPKTGKETVLERRQRGMRPCTPGCKGWDVFDTSRGFHVQACDECNRIARAGGLPQVSDADVQRLPEAQHELRRHTDGDDTDEEAIYG